MKSIVFVVVAFSFFCGLAYAGGVGEPKYSEVKLANFFYYPSYRTDPSYRTEGGISLVVMKDGEIDFRATGDGNLLFEYSISIDELNKYINFYRKAIEWHAIAVKENVTVSKVMGEFYDYTVTFNSFYGLSGRTMFIEFQYIDGNKRWWYLIDGEKYTKKCIEKFEKAKAQSIFNAKNYPEWVSQKAKREAEVNAIFK